MQGEARIPIDDNPTAQEVITALHAAPDGTKLKSDEGEEFEVAGGSARGLLLKRNAPKVTSAPKHLNVRLLNACFELEAFDSVEQADGCHLQDLKLFSSNVRSVPRWDARAPARARVSLRGRHVDGSLLDASSQGLSLAPNDLAQSQWLSSDLVNISFQSEDKTVDGAARLIRRTGAEGERLAFDFAPQMENVELMQALLSMRFPQQKPRNSVDSSMVEELMIQSGYAELRAGHSIGADWLGLNIPRVSIDRVYVDRNDQAIGHISITRSYRHSWIAHQLATVRAPESFDCRLSIYQMAMYMIPLLTEGEDGLIMAYFDRAKPWHCHFFESFVRWMGDSAESTIADLDRFEAASFAEARLMPAPDFVELAMATEDEIPQVAEMARRLLPPLTSRALDLRARSLRSDALHPDYAATCIERTRDVMVLRLRGTVVGAALLERGTGLSLFGLFDMAQFFFDPLADVPVAARLQLIEAARSWYRERGVSNPMLVMPKGSLPRDAHKAVVWAETMGLISLSARAMRHYENFLEFTSRWAQLKKAQKVLQ